MGKKKWKYPTKEVVDGKWRDTKCYQTWSCMMRRCTDKKYQQRQPTYIGCSVCDGWKDFDKFYEWFKEHYREGFQLDKDILYQDNKLYSPSTCVFVPQYINLLLVKRDVSRGDYPIGVHFKKQRNKFTAQLAINGKKKHIGCFTCPFEAHKAYCEAKYAYIKETASNALKIGDIDDRTYDALIAHKIEMY